MEAENRYKKLVNYLTDYIYTVKIKNNTAIGTYHGPGCVAITGYTPDDYLKDSDLWYRMIHPKDRENVLRQAQLALIGEECEPVEHRIIHQDGTTRWIKNKIVITKNDTGQPVSYDGLINDITALKRAETAAAHRSRQLRQAEKMASLGTLVAGIAHEVNNPNNFLMLNALLFTKMWKDALPILDEYSQTNGEFCLAGIPYSECKDKIAQSLDGIVKGSERISTITKRLTEYAKLDSDSLNETVDINSVIEMSVAITGTLIKQSTSNFTMNLATFLPRIRGNAQQLEQVVVNLITNACQSLQDTFSEIKITTAYDAERNRIRISIEDHGIGIKESDINFIMDPFFTTKRNSGGTGLGLSVSYAIVKNHNGMLTFKSEEHKGTTARILLPVPRELESLKQPIP
ncbi:MAG: ATP-binding protein [Bacteriovoracaceae bacterium]|nr:ATP-binding protein [Bacteroidota bacterium]